MQCMDMGMDKFGMDTN